MADQLGSKVTLVGSDSEEATWILVDPAEADTRNGSISTDSPVGHALMGKRKGDSAAVNTPGGEIVYLTTTSPSPNQRFPTYRRALASGFFLCSRAPVPGMESNHLELSDLQEIRRQKAEALRERGPRALLTGANRTHTTAEAHDRYVALESTAAGESVEDDEVITLAGRIVSFRDMGKTLFAHIRDGHAELQLFVRLNDVGEQAHSDFGSLVDLGDFVEATGTLFRTDRRGIAQGPRVSGSDQGPQRAARKARKVCATGRLVIASATPI